MCYTNAFKSQPIEPIATQCSSTTAPKQRLRFTLNCFHYILRVCPEFKLSVSVNSKQKNYKSHSDLANRQGSILGIQNRTRTACLYRHGLGWTRSYKREGTTYISRKATRLTNPAEIEATTAVIQGGSINCKIRP